MSFEIDPHPSGSEAPQRSPHRWRYVLLGILVLVVLAGLHLLRQAL